MREPIRITLKYFSDISVVYFLPSKCYVLLQYLCVSGGPVKDVKLIIVTAPVE